MDPVDITFALFLGYATVRGYSRGLLGTAASYVAPVLAFMVAADWSGPVREYLAGVFPAPDFVLDLAAPAVVFVAVITAVRIVSSLLARFLGIGMSMPSRLVAASTGAFVTAVVLGAFVTLVHEMAHPDQAFATSPDDSGQVIAAPVQNLLVNLDRRLASTQLGPPLAEMVSSVIGEALPLFQLTRDGDGSLLAPGEAARRLGIGARESSPTPVGTGGRRDL